MPGPDTWNPFRRLTTASVSFVILLSASSLIAKPSPSATPNEQILRAQLFLDGSNFKPGVIDGHWGEFMRNALLRYEAAEGKSSGQFGERAPDQFDLPF